MQLKNVLCYYNISAIHPQREKKNSTKKKKHYKGNIDSYIKPNFPNVSGLKYKTTRTLEQPKKTY